MAVYADGSRRKRSVGGATTVTIGAVEIRNFKAAGELLLRYPVAGVRLQGSGLGTPAFLHRDQVDSIQLITDGAGADAEHTTYQPFGEARNVAAGTIAAETKGYVGERYDASPGLQYLNARYYDPELSLFTSPDWLEVTEPGVGTNRYAYAGNSPVNQSDPGGNCPSCIGAAVGGLVGLAGQFASDVVNGDWSSPNDYAASAFSGAVVGGTFGLAAPAVTTLGGAVALGGATGQLGTVTDGLVRNGTVPGIAEQAVGFAVGAVLGPLARPVTVGKTSLAATEGADGLAAEIGILKDSVRGKGNFGLGQATTQDAKRLGEAWVGSGYKVASDRKTLISADGLRQFRPSSYKPRRGISQANFERRFNPTGEWQSNGHLDIVP